MMDTGLPRMYIASELRNGVLKITLDRPAKKNALTPEMFLALCDYLHIAASDPGIRCVLLAGSGPSFCSGADVSLFRLTRTIPYRDKPATKFMRTMALFEKPVVAAVSGHAVGIGVTMLLHCDLVYASSGAQFRTSFIDLGLTPEFGSTYLLPRMMGHARAAELLLLGKGFTAEQAHALGLVSAVLAPEQVLTHAEDMAAEIAGKPPQAMIVSKRLMKAHYHASLLRVLDEESAEFSAHQSTPECIAAIDRFMSSRAARNTPTPTECDE